MSNPESSPENTPEQQIQLPLTKEQQEMIHRATGEYVNFL